MTEYTVKTYIADAASLDISAREVARYLGYSREAIVSESDPEIVKTIEEVRPLIAGKACYCRYPLSFFDTDGVELPYGPVRSADLRRNLEGCSGIYVFAATIGAGFDRALKRVSLRSMAEAAYWQAAGAAAIEAVCDALNKMLEEEAAEQGLHLRRRFSPGYGDLGLENQKGVFQILNPSKLIGLSLMDSLIMSPEKSVTALIGIGE
ncbi:MAG: Vitamin B12 dependent methionine synthase activation subunit [Lachnospiraceae bacterium]|nr:Vitamin B12 dependent methionine synthase activation subunit [Lachnospiraceae bacterium]